MTTTEFDDAEIGTGANRTGLYLAILQLVFTLGWTTYVIYLPKLAADVGIAPSAVILILMLDQAIFTITDTVMGAAADKIAPFVGRLGLFVGLLTGLSCAAFVALPFVARRGQERANLAHCADRGLVDHIVGAARAAADLARQPLRQAADPVPVGARHARLRGRRRWCFPRWR